MSEPLGWSRRRFLAGLGATALLPLGCLSHPTEITGGGSARLTAKPGLPNTTLTPGTYPLGLGTATYDGLLLVPGSYLPGSPKPLVLALHGAGSTASGPINFLRPYAEAHGFLVLSVDSVGITWDAITFKYLSDVLFIDRALAHAFSQLSVDPARIVVQGFSDGATYALGLGLANGDLFRRVVAFSPGGIVRSDSRPEGKPEFFISHGRQDPVLRIDYTSRLIVPNLRNQGYSVEYLEFDGGHDIPAPVAEQASEWLTR
jgi:predicted esterase